MSHEMQFNPQKIFITLFVLTAIEVGWGYSIPYDNKLLLWGGLLAFALWKGLLIFMYFMHMKFEGWICKCLIAPTPILIMIVIFALWPDVVVNDQLIYGLAEQFDPQQGKVVEIGNSTNDPRGHGAQHIGADGELHDAEDEGETGH